MNKAHLTEKNISSKTDKWLSELDIPKSRIDQFKIKPKKSVLLVIDMQKFFLNKKSHAYLPAGKIIIPRINSIIKEYRKQKLPIIFTYHAYNKDENPGIMNRWWGDVIRVNNPLSKIDSTIDWKKTDITIQKKRYSAFIGTKLDQILKNKKIKQLIIVGVMTHLCCETTARHAFMKDYEVYFAIDATATDEEALHISSLKTLADGFAMPVTTKNILEALKTGT